jgi:L-asparaginase
VKKQMSFHSYEYDQKKIIVLTTGGTIAMLESDKTEGVKLQDPTILQSSVPLLSQYADIYMEHVCNMPSPHITPHEMFLIAERVKAYLDQPDVTGVVITHGTDTLEETAYFLDLVISHHKPVVVTGAMRSVSELGSDGPYNMVNAVRVASHPKSVNLGTIVVFHDEIHAARTVTKTHASHIATFQSPFLGPIGWITKKEILFSWSLSRKKHLPNHIPTHHVSLIKAAAGTDDAYMQWAIDHGTDGFVIEALGQGNLPPLMLPGVKQAIKQQIPIVLVSRCHNGIVEDTYDYEGGGKRLKEMGLIFSNGINGQKARIQLMLALQVTHDPKELQTYFHP